MRQQRHPPGKTEQRGAALMVMLVIMIMGGAAFLVSSLSSSALRTARQETTAAALAQAKEALIGYAITYGDTHPGEVHGYLPCPDINGSNGEGSSPLGSCGSQNVSQLGRLPWRTLDLPALRDGNGECLWYAVSGTYKNNPKTSMMNWDTNGQLQSYAADGITRLDSDDNQVVAVIFAPGTTREGQDRSGIGAPICGGNYTASAYLDDDTDHAINNADIAAGKSISPHEHRDADGSIISSINDQFVYITRQDIWNAMLKRNDLMATLTTMTQKTAECIADYGRNNNSPNDPNDKRLPWSGRSSPAIATDCTYRDGSSTTKIMYGRLPNRVSGSRSLTDNQIPLSSCTGGTDSRYQLKSDGSNCPSVPDWSTYYPWWSNWKDHVFYTLAHSYRPEAGSSPSCGTCLRVNGSGSYAAIVIFSGQKLSTQTRTTDTDRLDFANYLEGNNFISSTPINTLGNGDYKSGISTGSFNDVLYCIDPDNLTVSPC